METIHALRKLDPPVGRDPRIDLAEANAAQHREDYKHELEMGVEGEQRAQAQQSRLLVAEALGYQAHASRLLGDLKKSIDLSARAGQVFAAAGDHFGEARALENIGNTSIKANDLAGAEEAFQRALEINRQLGNKVEEALSLQGIAGVSSYPAQNEPQARIEGDAILVRSLIAQKKLSDARPVVASDEQLMSTSEDWMSRVSADIARAQFLAASGGFGEAIELLQARVEKCRKSGFGRLELEARLALGEAEIKAGNSPAGRAELKRLERDARAKGFVLIARKAAAATKQH